MRLARRVAIGVGGAAPSGRERRVPAEASTAPPPAPGYNPGSGWAPISGSASNWKERGDGDEDGCARLYGCCGVSVVVGGRARPRRGLDGGGRRMAGNSRRGAVAQDRFGVPHRSGRGAPRPGTDGLRRAGDLLAARGLPAGQDPHPRGHRVRVDVAGVERVLPDQGARGADPYAGRADRRAAEGRGLQEGEIVLLQPRRHLVRDARGNGGRDPRGALHDVLRLGDLRRAVVLPERAPGPAQHDHLRHPPRLQVQPRPPPHDAIDRGRPGVAAHWPPAPR